jgi:hypothetical protein
MSAFPEFSKHFALGPSKPKVTRTAADRHKYRSATNEWLQRTIDYPHSSDAQRRRAKAEQKRRAAF